MMDLGHAQVIEEEMQVCVVCNQPLDPTPEQIKAGIVKIPGPVLWWYTDLHTERREFVHQHCWVRQYREVTPLPTS